MTLLTERELRTTRKSVISAPACPPTPTPAVPIALGAVQAVYVLSSPYGVCMLKLLTSILHTSNDDTRTRPSREEEAGLEYSEDSESSSVLQNAARNNLQEVI